MLNIVLNSPEIPPNTGNIIRLGACFGISIDIIEPTGYVFDDKKFRRSLMDYKKYADFKRSNPNHLSNRDFILAN